jgi:flagellum-specific peptidoglycan hydrolase FlgJ
MATPDQLAKLAAVVPIAQATRQHWGVPASVTLAQWITESSWGTSKLATTANNCFGIKHSTLKAAENYVEFPTWEYVGGQKVLAVAQFVKFGSVEGCFDAHARLLATAARYNRAMHSIPNPKVFAVELQKAGYSTNPRYATDLLALMREFNLTQYDPPATPVKEIT